MEHAVATSQPLRRRWKPLRGAAVAVDGVGVGDSFMGWSDILCTMIRIKKKAAWLRLVWGYPDVNGGLFHFRDQLDFYAGATGNLGDAESAAGVGAFFRAKHFGQ